NPSSLERRKFGFQDDNREGLLYVDQGNSSEKMNPQLQTINSRNKNVIIIRKAINIKSTPRTNCNASQLPATTRKIEHKMCPVNQARNFSHSKVTNHKEISPPKEDEGVKINFITREGDKISIMANEGDSIMDITQAHDIDLECACEGSLACSTCHVIVEPEYYAKLEEPSDEENDMLDLAFGLTET
ncbi:4201_t:CDS:2, partial [Acaulospora morrowiae]